MDLRLNLCYLDVSQRVISHRSTIYLRKKGEQLRISDLQKAKQGLAWWTPDVALLCLGKPYL